MTSFTSLPSLDILERFFAFVAEMNRQRALAEHASAPPADPAAPAGDFPSFLLDAPVAAADRGGAPHATVPDIDPELLLDRLQSYIEADIRDFARQGTDLLVAQFREAQYAMVALADDIFLHEVAWNGRDTWRYNHLEHRIFQSRLAGDRIFERIEGLLAANDRRLIQLASVYLCILSLGFKGRFRGTDDDTLLRSQAARLFRLVSGREPALFAEWSGHHRQPVIASAYAHTVSADRANPGPWRLDWRRLLAAAAATWLVGGQILWLSASAPLSDAAAAVLKLAGEIR